MRDPLSVLVGLCVLAAVVGHRPTAAEVVLLALLVAAFDRPTR